VNLRGKTRGQLEVAVRHKSRSELIDLIYSLVTVEQLLKPAEIASRSCLNKRAVLRDIAMESSVTTIAARKIQSLFRPVG
jgi:hypothetical protein